MIEAIRIGRKASDHWLLHDVSLTLRPGERQAVVGASGGGKTLMLRAIAMLDPLDSGEVRWQGRRVDAHDIPAFRSRVMYFHQRATLVEGTVEDNLRQPFSLKAHRGRAFNRPYTIELLESLGRGESFLAKKQRDLSGGESQITALLRGMQLAPDVALLDEPTAALDVESTNLVETLVSTWLDEQPAQRAILWVTHDLSQASRVANTIHHISHGRMTT